MHFIFLDEANSLTPLHKKVATKRAVLPSSPFKKVVKRKGSKQIAGLFYPPSQILLPAIEMLPNKLKVLK